MLPLNKTPKCTPNAIHIIHETCCSVMGKLTSYRIHFDASIIIRIQLAYNFCLDSTIKQLQTDQCLICNLTNYFENGKITTLVSTQQHNKNCLNFKHVEHIFFQSCAMIPNLETQGLRNCTLLF